jgi:acetaldehyde/propanal dehydrogenase
MQNKIKAAIIGPGNIGTDLLMKAMRSDVIEPVWMVGVVAESPGLRRATKMGLKTTAEGVDGMLPTMKADGVQICFDATSAYVHAENSRKVIGQAAVMIDLTPAAIGPFCVPPVNLSDAVAQKKMNVNMVTCGGQATIPLVAAVSRVPGPGTRRNIDEFTRTTAKGVEVVGGANTGKAIIIINPAEPPLIMRDTVHCLTMYEPEEDAITQSVNDIVTEVQKYVPGYKLKNGPVFGGKRVSVYMEVKGLGDFLPEYAGNLDIMTAAGVRTAEMYSEEIIAGNFVPKAA